MRGFALRLALAGLVTACLFAGTACRRTLEAYPEEFAGVGVVLQAEGSGFVVSRVVDGGPAAQSGLAPGGVLKAVDGKPVDGRSLAAVVGLLRGAPGSAVALTLERGGLRETVSLTRRALAKDGEGYHAR